MAVQYIFTVLVAVALVFILVHIAHLRGKIHQKTRLCEAAEEKYRVLIENAYEGIGVIQDERYDFVNPSMTKIFGYSRRELTHRNKIEFVHPDDRKMIRSRFLRKRQGEEVPASYPVRILTKAGDTKWLKISSARIAWEGKPADLEFISDITDLKQVEEELRLYRELYLNSKDGIVILDAEGRYIDSNPEHHKRSGYTKEELKARGVDGIIGPKAGDIFRDGMEAGQSIRREVTAYRKDGKEVTVDISGFPIKDEGGDIRYFVGIGRDITEKKRAQEALSTRLRYEEGLEACSRVLMKGTSDESSLQEALKYLLEASGSSRVYIFENFEDPEKGLSMRQTHEVCAEGIQPSFDDPLKREYPYDPEFERWKSILAHGEAIVGTIETFPQTERHVLAAQGILSLLVLPIMIGGEWFGFVGFDDCKNLREGSEEDIRLLRTASEIIGTYIEHKRFEEVLRISEERFRSLVENAKDVIYSMTPEGKFTYLSPQFKQVTGFEVSEYVGKSLEDLLHPQDLEQSRRWLEMGMPKEETPPGGYEFRTKTKDNGWRWLTTSASVIRDEGGKPLEAIGVAHDITEMKRVLEDLEKANREIRDAQTQLVQTEKMATLGMLVAGVAHEINTPFGAVASMHDTMERAVQRVRAVVEKADSDVQDREQTLEKAFEVIDKANEVIDSGIDRVSEIVRRLRSFARLDEAELKEVDIHEGLEDTLTIIHHQIKHNIEVVKRYSTLPLITCYPGQLNQVFLNVLMNAYQAIVGKGTITIETVQKNNTIEVSISDTGIGISKENLEKIFDPGFTTKGVGIGTGLGLPISYRIVQFHRGQIKVKSEEGKGSTFTILLPMNLKELMESNIKKD